MKHLSLLIAAVALVLTQCERHSWEDVKDADGNLTEKGTKRLFESHGDQGGGHGKDGGGHSQDGGGHGQDGDADKKAEPEGDGKADH